VLGVFYGLTGGYAVDLRAVILWSGNNPKLTL